MLRWKWIPVGVVAVLGAGVIVLLAVGLRVVDCKEEADSPCSNESLALLVIAIGGLVPAGGTFVQGVRRSGRPLPWFLATAFVYAMWGLFAWGEFGG